MRNLIICALTLLAFSAQAPAFNVVIDGVLDEPVYTMVEALKGDISSLYLVPMSDALYIGAVVEDANINFDQAYGVRKLAFAMLEQAPALQRNSL
jgi:hypothetical protein